jgi:hypothetical protein
MTEHERRAAGTFAQSKMQVRTHVVKIRDAETSTTYSPVPISSDGAFAIITTTTTKSVEVDLIPD